MDADRVQAILRRVHRASELRRCWAERVEFEAVFKACLRSRLSPRQTALSADARVFLDNVVARLIASVDDLVSACTMLGEEAGLAREFMRFYVRHDLADHDVIFSLIECPEVFHSLPDDPAWMEVAVLLYGSARLVQADGRKITIAELAPLGLDVERSTVRSLVGSAFDAGILADEDRERLLVLFPGDPYFKAKLQDEKSDSA